MSFQILAMMVSLIIILLMHLIAFSNSPLLCHKIIHMGPDASLEAEFRNPS